MKKEIIIALSITLGPLLAVVATFITGLSIYVHFASDDPSFHTENIEDYNTEEYPVPLYCVFLDEIPENATVVRFSNYNYWNEDRDIYLELKFETKEEMDEYLSAIKEYCKESFAAQHNFYKTTDPFIEVQNIHDEDFVDLFYRMYGTSIQGEELTGYQSDWLDNDRKNKDYYIDCSFAVISYSYDKLTVIQSYSGGWFFEGESKYTPQYLIRFSLPIGEEFERYYNVIAED